MKIASLILVDSGDLPRTAAERVAGILQDAVNARGRASLALAGGTTPRAMHEELGRIPAVPWASVEVFFGDERCVPPEHPDSNYRMAKESLLDRVGIPAANVHRPAAEAADRGSAAAAYARLLPSAFDLIVLGIGEDGHTASLFPGSPALAERERLCVPVVGPKPPPERLTLTPPALLAARKLLVLASGASKAEPVARALRGAWDPSATPAQLARGGEWIVDRAAGALLAPAS